jgi:5-formyltetrahydrofolate cyclo-ligase
VGSKRKKLLRAEMKRILAHLDPRWVGPASNEICSRLQTLIQQLPIEVEHILTWSSFFEGEVDLSRFIEQSLARCKVYLPRVLEDASMTFVSVGQNWHEQISPGPYGVKEPSESGGQLYRTEWAQNTVVIVPGLAFSQHGDRLGRGKGCYDRFFARPGMSEAVKIGTCFSIQLADDIPIESFDALMDWICTEEGFLQTVTKDDLMPDHG